MAESLARVCLRCFLSRRVTRSIMLASVRLSLAMLFLTPCSPPPSFAPSLFLLSNQSFMYEAWRGKQTDPLPLFHLPSANMGIPPPLEGSSMRNPGWHRRCETTSICLPGGKGTSHRGLCQRTGRRGVALTDGMVCCFRSIRLRPFLLWGYLLFLQSLMLALVCGFLLLLCIYFF